jgi:hypothetical protein
MAYGGRLDRAGARTVAVPGGFPSAVPPRPSGGTLQEAETTQTSPGAGYDLICRHPSAGAANQALTGYDGASRSAGFDEKGSFSGSGTTAQSWMSADWAVSITVGPFGSSSASALALTLQRVAPGSTSG